jgi:hypothetical protein
VADEHQPSLAGAAGDDVSAGTSVSGVGGEALRTEDDDGRLRPVDEQGARIGWGKMAREVGQQSAPNDGTGQSERSPD